MYLHSQVISVRVLNTLFTTVALKSSGNRRVFQDYVKSGISKRLFCKETFELEDWFPWIITDNLLFIMNGHLGH